MAQWNAGRAAELPRLVERSAAVWRGARRACLQRRETHGGLRILVRSVATHTLYIPICTCSEPEAGGDRGWRQHGQPAAPTGDHCHVAFSHITPGQPEDLQKTVSPKNGLLKSGNIAANLVLHPRPGKPNSGWSSLQPSSQFSATR